MLNNDDETIQNCSQYTVTLYNNIRNFCTKNWKLTAIIAIAILLIGFFCFEIGTHYQVSYIKRVEFEKMPKFTGDHLSIKNIEKINNDTKSSIDNILYHLSGGGQFWSLESSCESAYKDSVAITLTLLDQLKFFLKKRNACLTSTTEDSKNCESKKRIINIIGIQGGQAIDNRLGVLRTYYRLGVRYMTLTTNCDTNWATHSYTNNTDIGLSYFGELIVKEMNRLGMIIDMSQSSVEVMNDVLKHTKAPVIFSNSASKTIFDHPFNVPDDVLIKLKEKHGVIMVLLNPLYLGYDPQKGNVIKTAIRHFNHIYNQIGCNHIGIGAAYYDKPGFAIGEQSSIHLADLFVELYENNSTRWNSKCIKKISQKNVLRVFRQVQKIGEMSSFRIPTQERISNSELTKDMKVCRTKLNLN